MAVYRLILDFYHPWANNAGFYLGRDLGYYGQEGIDLDISPYDPFRGDSLHRIAREEADFAFNYPNRLMMMNEGGANLLSVAACNDRSFEALIYDQRRPVEGFADLEDLRVAVPRSPRVRAVLRYMMEREGADPDRARLIEFFPAEPDPLDIAGGDIDCVYGSFWGWEGALARLENENIRWKEVSELGAPWCHSQIIAVNRTLAENEPGLVTGFLRATGRGFAAAAMEPERAAESMIMVAPVFTRAQFTAAVGLIAPTWRTGPGWGTHNLPLIRDYAQWLSRKGFLAHTCHDQEFTDELLT